MTDRGHYDARPDWKAACKRALLQAFTYLPIEMFQSWDDLRRVIRRLRLLERAGRLLTRICGS